tara:strand:+ start:903 stop:1166 length:264 start_codon:yes stop_codon:yes gene_type:complete
MNTISVQGFKIDISHFETQISKSGRPFRLSRVGHVLTKPAVWVDKMLIHGTYYTFRYLDAYDEFFGFEFDSYNNFVCKMTKEQLEKI